MDAALAELVAMGFGLEQATQALLDADGDVNQAAEALLNARTLRLNLPSQSSQSEQASSYHGIPDHAWRTEQQWKLKEPNQPIRQTEISSGQPSLEHFAFPPTQIQTADTPAPQDEETKRRLKAAEESRKLIRKQRREEEETRKRTLELIKQDRLRQQQKRTLSSSISQPKSGSTSSAAIGTSSNTLIQIRLLDGRTIRQQFPVASELAAVFEFANPHLDEVIREQYQLLLPFPRTVFTHDHGSQTLTELGLVPNASLNVFVPQPVEEEQNEETELDEPQPMEADINQSSAEESEEEQEEAHQPANRQEISAAVQARLERLSAFNRDQGRKQTKAIKPLSSICLEKVKTLFLDPQLFKYVRDLRALSPTICEKLFHEIVELKRLDKIIVKRFSNSNLLNVNLNYYHLASDAILEALAMTHKRTIERISLRGCSVITDKGVIAFQGTQNLVYLDLHGCRITDTASAVLASLMQLEYLDISDTKISILGLQIIASMLTNLSGLDISHLSKVAADDLFFHLCKLSNLQFLALDDVSLPEIIQISDVSFPRLHHLKANRTNLNDKFFDAQPFPSLRIVELSGNSNITTTGLLCLMKNCSQLTSISWPSHNIDMDVLLVQLSQLPIEQLDLEAFAVSNLGLLNIANLKPSLTRMNLSRTNVTDTCLKVVSELTNLKELRLHKCNVSDDGVFALNNLSALEILDLSETGVTDISIHEFHRAALFKRSLKKLDLSRTRITDEGVAKLHVFESLMWLSLDSTGITERSRILVANMPLLTSVRFGLQTPQANQRRNQFEDADNEEEE